MAKCKACGAEIIWIKTARGKAMPIDEKPIPYYKGNNDRIITPDRKIVRCDLDGKTEDFIGFGYISHFATCPAAERFRRKK